MYRTCHLNRRACGEVLKPGRESTQSRRAGTVAAASFQKDRKSLGFVNEADSVIPLVTTACLADCERLSDAERSTAKRSKNHLI